MNFAMINCGIYHYVIAFTHDGASQGSIVLVGTQLLHIGKLSNRNRGICRCNLCLDTEAKSKSRSNGKYVFRKRKVGAKGLGIRVLA
jgi:hypothetical protein